MKTSDCCMQFCNIIRLEKKEIISDWIALIKTVIVEAKEQSRPVLVDHIPQILDNLSDLLEVEAQGEDHKKEIKKEELGKAHGRQRAELTEYSLEEVLVEYSVLRKVIINRIHKCEMQDLTAIQLIHKYLDDGMHNAVIEFVKIQNKNIGSQETKIIVYENMHNTVRTMIQTDEYEVILDYYKSGEEIYCQLSKEDLDTTLDNKLVIIYKNNGKEIDINYTNKTGEDTKTSSINQKTLIVNSYFCKRVCTVSHTSSIMRIET